MKAELMELLEGFSKSLTVWKYNSYVFKVRDYFIPYLLENKQYSFYNNTLISMECVPNTETYAECNK